MNLDDIRVFNKDEKEKSIRESLVSGERYNEGMQFDGQGYMRLRLNGVVETVTFRVKSQKQLLEMAPTIIRILYEAHNDPERI